MNRASPYDSAYKYSQSGGIIVIDPNDPVIAAIRSDILQLSRQVAMSLDKLAGAYAQALQAIDARLDVLEAEAPVVEREPRDVGKEL